MDVQKQLKPEKTAAIETVTVSELLKHPLPKTLLSICSTTHDHNENANNKNEKSRSEIDAIVTFWDQFRNDVTHHGLYRYTQKIPKPVKTDDLDLWATTIDVETAVKTQILDVVGEIAIKYGERFGDVDLYADVTRGLHPDFAFVNTLFRRNDIYFIVEVRKTGNINLKNTEKLSDLYNSRLRSSRQTRKIVRDVYLYMAELNLRYAVLTTYFQTWFFKLDNNVLSISDTFDYNSITPSVLESFAYLMHLSRQNRFSIKKHQFLSIFDTKTNRKYFAGDPQPRNKRIKLDLGDYEDKITVGDFLSGGEFTASVFEAKCGSLEFVMKICDRIKDPGIYKGLKNEVEIYTDVLNEIQGRFIPKFYFTWEDEFRFGFAVQNGGERVDFRKLSSYGRTKLLKSLSEIHKLGVRHGDLGARNILMTEDDNFLFIDFAGSKGNSSKTELDEETEFLAEILENANNDDSEDYEDSEEDEDSDEFDDPLTAFVFRRLMRHPMFF